VEDHGVNIYNYGARMYDPVIGRFFTKDRFLEKYFDLSPYQYGANNPIKYIDVNGDSIVVAGSQEFKEQTTRDIAQLKKSNDNGVAGMVTFLEESDKLVTISEASSILGTVKNFFSEGSGDLDHLRASEVRGNGVDPVSGEKGVSLKYSQLDGVEIDGVKTKSHTTLGHELQHAKDIVDGTMVKKRDGLGKSDAGGGRLRDFAESRALQMENKVRKAEGSNVLRTNYIGKQLLNDDGSVRKR